MKQIDIVFSKSKKFFPVGSWLIRFWTRKSYSHVSRYKLIMNESMYFQANEGKVNYEHESIFSTKHEIVKRYCLEVSDELNANMSKECLKQAGQPYAVMQNLGIVLVDIANFFNIKTKNPWKKGKNCSELLYITILKPLYPELDYNPDTIKPHHIEYILLDKGHSPC